MLQQLHIINYAIIEEIKINFSSQLNIITGETGAGKSILMGALNLILGERAESNALANQDKKCIIEGVFNVKQKPFIKSFFEQHELELEEELILRREIAASGKSRAFINDSPVTLQQLKQLARLLVDLHQQFDTLELGDSQFQREVVDALAENQLILKQYFREFKQWLLAKKEVQQLINEKANFQKELDYNQFLFNELNELSLKENELEDAETELKILTNCETIKATLSKVLGDLSEAEQPVIATLKHTIHQMQNIVTFHQEVEPVVNRLQSCYIELQDIASEIEHINDSVIFDDNKINALNEKLNLGYKLQKKHNVNSTNALLEIQVELEQKLLAVLQIDEAIITKEKQVLDYFDRLNSLANTLSINRKKQVSIIEKQVNGLLAQVGMPNALIKVSITDMPLNEFGNNAIEFLFDANKSGRFEPIKKVASGGELSRLMLCIKSLVAQKIDLATLIFDEIDTGISGEAAKQVGAIMKNLAIKRQIICITHQPQIAAKANSHLFVYKDLIDDKVKTNIKLLSQDERVIAIARMLSGENPSEAALLNVKEMMN